MLTGRDVHEAYNQTLRDNPNSRSILTEWEEVSMPNRKMYERMAALLNEKLSVKSNEGK